MQRYNTIAKGVAVNHAVMCKHKGAGLHLKYQKEQVKITQTMEGELLLVLDRVICATLPLRCPSFRGHCCAQMQSQTNSSNRDVWQHG